MEIPKFLKDTKYVRLIFGELRIKSCITHLEYFHSIKWLSRNKHGGLGRIFHTVLNQQQTSIKSWKKLIQKKNICYSTTVLTLKLLKIKKRLKLDVRVSCINNEFPSFNCLSAGEMRFSCVTLILSPIFCDSRLTHEE